MKKFSLLIVLLLSLIIVKGQDQQVYNTKNTQVNIGITNIFAKNYIYYDYYFLDGEIYPTLVYDNLYNVPGLQLGLKFNNKKGAFRLSTSLSYSTLNQENDNDPTDKSSYSAFGSSLNLGYEWQKTIQRVVIYYGFDLTSELVNRKFKYINNNYNGYYESETKVNEYSYGIRPLLGLNVFLFENVSIGTEIQYTLKYYTGTEKSTYTGSQDSKSKFDGIKTYFGPLGFLSINIHL